MRVLLGLVAFSSLAFANAQFAVVVGGQATFGSTAGTASGPSAAATVNLYHDTAVSGNKFAVNLNSVNIVNTVPLSTQLNTGSPQSGNVNYIFTIQNSYQVLVWQVNTNTYASQLQYKFGYLTSTSNLNSVWYCDPCTTSSPSATAGTAYVANGPQCDAFNGPQATTVVGVAPAAVYTGYQCGNVQRVYTLNGVVVGTNSFQIGIFDNTYPKPNEVTYSFTITRQSGSSASGDPQISGLQGQDFQVHGIPDEIFNLISYPNLQVNARFVYLSSAECVDNFTACFAHPGTYIGEEGIRLGNDKVHIKSGSFKKGLTVSVNGQRVQGKHAVKLGSVEVVNHRRVVVTTPVMTLTISNSDKFLNQESSLHDRKLLSLGVERRVLADGEQFHPEVPLHGLQGQTWRNVEYPSGLEYEGSINDYHVVDGNLYGTEFVFNQFKL